MKTPMLSAFALCVTLVAQAGAPAAADASDALARAYLLFIQGRTLEGKNDISGAAAAYRQAMTLMPDAAEPHAELSGLMARSGRLTEAETEANAALKLEPANREANRTLGLVQSEYADRATSPARRTQLIKEAIGHLELALADRIVDPSSQFSLGRLYLMSDQSSKAVDALRLFLLDQPGYPDAMMLLAAAYDDLDRTQEAIDTLKELAGAEPSLSIALDRLGDLYFQNKQYREAAAVWDRALSGDRAGVDVASITRKRDRARELGK